MGVSALLEFFNYWWTRYLLTTELYMVEKWERVTIRKFRNLLQKLRFHLSIASFSRCHILYLVHVDLVFQLLDCLITDQQLISNTCPIFVIFGHRNLSKRRYLISENNKKNFKFEPLSRNSCIYYLYFVYKLSIETKSVTDLRRTDLIKKNLL